MARKTKVVEITADGRDKGKVFLLTEMPSSRGERWALRLLMAMGNRVPPEIAALGMAGLASVGLNAIAWVQFDDAEILLNEMMACVQIIPDPQNPSITRSPVEEDIQEVMTRAKLKMEVFELHTGFSLAAAMLGSTSATATQGT